METIGLTTSGATTATKIDSGANDTKPGYSAGLRLLGTATADFSAIRWTLTNKEGLTKERHLINVGVAGADVCSDVLLKIYSDRVSGGLWIFKGGSSGDEIQIDAQTSAASDTFTESYATLYTADELPGTPGTTASSYMGSAAATLRLTTEGLNLDPGGTANTEVKTEITTSGGLNEDTDFLNFQFVPKDDAIGTDISWIIKVYTGATGATDSGLAFYVFADTADVNYDGFYEAFVDRTVFASGTRVWLGVQCTNTNTLDRIMMATMQGYQFAPASGGSTVLNQGILSGGRM